ncbi:methyltransferase domain-containing protein [bacterium]|nr:methyltransferase domain-containing protein [bacterium]
MFEIIGVRNVRPENPADLFQQGWDNYRLILGHDYLWHSLAGQKLRKVVVSQFRPSDTIRFLDLACGSCKSTSLLVSDLGGVRVMMGQPPIEFVGVDNSPEALRFAKCMNFGTSVRVTFVESDFVEYLRGVDSLFEVIYIGMSAHHLGLERLPDFFAQVKKSLAPGGIFVAYEPFCLPGETRNVYIERLHRTIREKWTKLKPEGIANVIAHTGECDFAVTLADWNAAAEKAGMKPGEMVFESPDQLFAIVVHEA